MWHQLQIENCLPANLDKLNDLLESTDALSITITDKNDDAIFEPELGSTPLWPEIIIQALYDSREQAELVMQLLRQSKNNFVITMQSFADQDWQRTWMKDLKPQQYGEKLWICPTWITPPDPQAINLKLDPGLAFGTGSHPTTRLCLNWLADNNLTAKKIIDYGCGSGILALAALKLGAKQVYAVDIDPQALQAVNNNAALNELNSAQLQIGLPEILNNPVDIIIANILLKPLIDLKSSFHSLLNNKGILIVSGILTEQLTTLIENYQDKFKQQQFFNLNDWSLVVFEAR